MLLPATLPPLQRTCFLSLAVNDKTTGTLTLEPRAADELDFDVEFDGEDEERDDSDW